MKNAMKKLFSLMLVAVLLVSAVPFQADAATVSDTGATVPVDVYVMKPNGSTSGPHTKELTVASGATVNLDQDTARSLLTDNKESRILDHWESSTGTNITNDHISYAGLSGLTGDELTNYRLAVYVREANTPAVHEHNFVAGAITIPVGCLTDGTQIYTCACGESESRPITARGYHVYSNPTCTAPKTCDCGATEGNALGHNWVEDTARYDAPKCTTGGSKVFNCTNAGCTVKKYTETLAALGHAPGANGKCTNTGCTYEETTSYVLNFCLNYDNNFGFIPKGAYKGDSINNVYTPYRYGYNFAGWYEDKDCTIPVADNAIVTGPDNFYAKWTQVAAHEVYVRVYSNGNTNNVYAIIDLYGYAQDDGVITKADIESAVANYGIKANNAAGLSVYGPFTPAQWNSYCLDDYYRNTTEKVTVNSNEKTVLYAMVHNVQINGGSSSSGTKADSSNPKTGDMIFAPMIVLGASASCLAVLYYLNKKRAI